MGSDAIIKGKRSRNSWIHRACVAVVSVCCVLLTGNNHWEYQPSDTFSVDDDDDYLTGNLPSHCQNYAARFHNCQQQSDHTLVIACHRKWCESSWGGGYCCSAGGGLGSRTRYALTMIQRAVDMCIKVEIDAPSTALLTAQDAKYRDPMGILAEAFHFRSYGGKVDESRRGWSGNVTDWTLQDTFFLHMTPESWISRRPNGMPAFDYDPCLFHVLFRPSKRLQLLIDVHYQHIGKTVGIHFRTGDSIAFNRKSGNDIRVTVDLNQALDKLVQCARSMAKRQGITATRFYLATDDGNVQKLAKKRDELITLDLDRTSWLHHDGDFDAWLEVFLLSRMGAIVVNEHDKSNAYRGAGDRISTFARLAAKIGFMDENQQLLSCKLG